MKEKIQSLTIALIIALVMMILLTTGVGSVINQNNSIERINTISTLNVLSSKLSYEINSRIYIGKGLEAIITENNGVSNQMFQNLADKLAKGDNAIRSITLIKGTIIEDVYPREGNISAIGTDLSRVEGQAEVIKEVIENKMMVTDGPVYLVQGGIGIINRVPLYIEIDGKTHYWGMISVVLSVEQVLENAGFNRETPIQYAISIIDDNNLEEIFIGDAALLDQNPIKQDILFHNREWIVSSVPLKGWTDYDQMKLIANIISLFISLFTGGIIGYLIYVRSQLKKTVVYDQLTGVSNRIMLYTVLPNITTKALREHHKTALIFIDVNDFKSINDNYGHQIGDLVLIEVADRLSHYMKDKKHVIRYGGDEFILIIPSFYHDSVIEKHLASIDAIFETPLKLGQLEYKISVSRGASVFPDNALNAEELISIADQKMYAHKARHKQNQNTPL